MSQQSLERRLVPIGDGGHLEVFSASGAGNSVTIAAAHPASALDSATVSLLRETSEATVVCLNPRGLGASSPCTDVALETMVDDLERARQQLSLGRWLFWGMSGGGWLAQLYAIRHPDSIAGIIVESACASFRERLRDPTCALSPLFPAWQDALFATGTSFAMPVEGEDGQSNPAQWQDLPGIGEVLCDEHGRALLVAPRGLDAGMKRGMPAFLRFDARPWLHQVRAPALVMAGERDPIVPVPRVREVHEKIAGSTFVVVSGGGHVPSATRAPAATAAVRDFVRSLSAS